MIERVSRERWRRALASLVGYVGDFDLAEESTQKAFAITLRLPRRSADGSSRWPRSPTGVERPLPAPTSRPTAGPPRTSSHSNRPPPRPGHRRRDRAMRRPPPLARQQTSICDCVGHLGGGARAPALRADRTSVSSVAPGVPDIAKPRRALRSAQTASPSEPRWGCVETECRSRPV